MKIGNKHHGDTGKFVGRPSPLGNPYHIGSDGTRSEVIEKYRDWLSFKILRSDPVVVAALRDLQEDDTLVCFCHPLACHATIIDDLWHWAKEHKLI